MTSTPTETTASSGVPVSYSRDGLYIRQFLGYLRREGSLVTAVLIALLFQHGFAMVAIELPRELLIYLTEGRTPAVLALVTDAHLTNVEMVAWSAALWCCALAAGYLAFFLYYYWADVLCERISRRVRYDAFSTIMSLPLLSVNNADLGPVVSRLVVNVDAIPVFVNKVLWRRLSDLVILSAMCIYLGLLSGWLLLTAAAFFPVLAVAALTVARRTRNLSERLNDAREEVTADIRETLAATREIRINAAEQRERAEFHGVLDRYYDRARRYHRFIWATEAILTALTEAVPIVVFGVGAYLAVTGRLSTATVVIFLMALPKIMLPFTRLLLTVEPYQHSIVPLRRLLDVVNWGGDAETLEGDRELPQPLPDVDPPLTLADASFTYRTGGYTVRFGNLETTTGRVYGLVGESGSGKSTLLLLLAKILGGYHGSIRLLGEELSALTRDAARRAVGIMSQEPFFFNRSIEANVCYGTNLEDVGRSEVERVCRMTRVHDDVITTLGGYDAPVRNQGENLSGGQKRRLALARALISEPRILLLDEPFAGIPPDQVQSILDTIREIARGRVVIIITHDLHVARQLDELLVFQRLAEADGSHSGAIVARGTPEQLQSSCDLYRRMMERA